MTDNKQTTRNNKSTIVGGSGNFVLKTENTVAGSRTYFTNPQTGHTVISSEIGTSEFNPNNSQNLTLGSSFNTFNNNHSTYVKRDKESRVEGDLITLVGATSNANQQVTDRWITEYSKGWGWLKSQFNDTRSSIPPASYPLNSVFNAPKAIGSLTVCPDLKTSTAVDNQNDENRKNFEDSLMNKDKIKESEASIELNKSLTESYANISTNINALNKVMS